MAKQKFDLGSSTIPNGMSSIHRLRTSSSTRLTTGSSHRSPVVVFGGLIQTEHTSRTCRFRRLGIVMDFAYDEDNQKVYYTQSGLVLQRANLDGSQLETLVAVPTFSPDGFTRRIATPMLDPVHGQLWFICGRNRGLDDGNVSLCRIALPPLPEPTKRAGAAADYGDRTGRAGCGRRGRPLG